MSKSDRHSPAAIEIAVLVAETGNEVLQPPEWAAFSARTEGRDGTVTASVGGLRADGALIV